MEFNDKVPNEAEFDPGESEMGKNIMIRNWLENMPSSQSQSELTLCSDDTDEHIPRLTYHPSSIPQQDAAADDASIKHLILSETSLRYLSTPDPARILSFAERESRLKCAAQKIPEINRKIANHPNYHPFHHIKGTAVWNHRSSDYKDKRRKKRWWNPHRVFSWFRTLSIFQWFWKNKKEEDETPVDNFVFGDSQTSLENDNHSSNKEVEQPVVFVPFQHTCTMNGREVLASKVFGGDNTIDEVRSALNSISFKINKEQFPTEQVPSMGYSDGEVLVPLSQVNPTESVQEIQRLTTLILEKKKPKVQMKSIFGIREFNRTEPQPAPIIVGRRDIPNPSSVNRTLQRISNFFRNELLRRRPPRRFLHRIREHRGRVRHFDNQPQAQFNGLGNNEFIVLQQEQQQQNSQQTGSVQNIMRHVVGGFRGLLRIFGVGREERVSPENQPPVPPQAPAQGIQGISIGGIRRRHRRTSDGLRLIVPTPGTIQRQRQNPLRRRILLAESEYRATIQSPRPIVVDLPSQINSEIQETTIEVQ